MNTIYLIRHGEIPSSMPRRFIGQSDLKMTAHGREQMANLAAYLVPFSLERIVSSPLQRCRQSADIIGSAVGCIPEVVDELSEIALGAWEGLTVADIQQQYPGEYEARGKDMTGYRPLDGESFADLLQRVWPAFVEVMTAGNERTAVVTHAGVNRVLLCHLLGMPLANLFRLEQCYGSINVVHIDKGKYRVECINKSVENR